LQKLIFFILISLIISPLDVASATPASPDSVAQEIITKVKHSKSLLSLLPYVHWQTAFETLSAKDKASLSVKSASELREKYRQLISSPDNYFRDNIQPKLSPTLPTIFDTVAKKVANGFGASIREFQRRAVLADYSVGDSSIKQNDAAIVAITVSNNGVAKKHNVAFNKIDGKWYLPSPQSLDNTGILMSALTGNLVDNLKFR